MTKKVPVINGEKWWGAASVLGKHMPFPEEFSCDLRGATLGNQASPMLISNAGRHIWSTAPFLFCFKRGILTLTGKGPFVFGRSGTSLGSAYRGISRRFFPSMGKIPNPLLFVRPQYNSWIELIFDQAQEPILNYARNIVKHGYPPGVLMIDEGWFRYYGHWDFDQVRFPDPRVMVEELHNLGFKVMLWVAPFVVPDSAVFRELRGTNILVKSSDGKPAVREWWNGHSAIVDVTGGEGRAWFLKKLHFLKKTYKVDGFKFDAGDAEYYRDDDIASAATTANDHTEAYSRLGLSFPLNEYRASWKCGGTPLFQRLRDKKHSWNDDGLESVIPNSIAQGLLGHSFVCPDMIGGGEYENFGQHRNRFRPRTFCSIRPSNSIDADDAVFRCTLESVGRKKRKDVS